MEPEQLPWKAFFDDSLAQRRHAAAHVAAGPPAHLLHHAAGPHGPAAARMRVHQRVPGAGAAPPGGPALLPHAAIMREPLFYSRRILDPATRQPLVWREWAQQGLCWVSDLRALVEAAPGDLPAAVRGGLPIMLAALPDAWAAALRSAAPPAQWLVSPDAADRRVWSLAAGGRLEAAHVAGPTGALQPSPLGAAGGPPPAGLLPALVMPWDPGRPWHPRHSSARQPTDPARQPTDPAPADQPAAAEGLPPPPPPPNYLVGTWQSGIIDSRTWGLGARPSQEYIVRVGTARQLLLRRMGRRRRQPLRRPAARHLGGRSFFFSFGFYRIRSAQVAVSKVARSLATLNLDRTNLRDCFWAPRHTPYAEASRSTPSHRNILRSYVYVATMAIHLNTKSVEHTPNSEPSRSKACDRV